MALETSAGITSPGVPSSGLSPDAVLQAIAGYCGADSALAAKLGGVLSELFARTQDWANQATRMSQQGFPARHQNGTLRSILHLPGDLALLHLHGGGFMLLSHKNYRWQTMDPLGDPVADVPDSAMDALTEAVVFHVPKVLTGSGELNSLRALWPALRAAWAEVGVASVLVNAGQLLLPLFSMLVYDKVVNNGVFETLWALVLGMVIYLLTDVALRGVRTWASELVAEDLTRRSDEGVWTRLVSQKDGGSGFARFLSNYRDLSVSRDFVSSTYLLMLSDLPFLVLYLVAVALVAWPLAILATLLVLLYSGAGYFVQVRNNRLGQEAEKINTRKLTYVGEILGAMDVVRTVPGSGAFLRRWRGLSDSSAHIDGVRRRVAGHANTLANGMLTFSTVAMLTAGAYLVNAGLLSVGGLIACNLLTGRAMSLVTSLFTVAGKWQDFQRAANRMAQGLAPVQAKEYTPRPAVRGQVAVVALTKTFKNRPVALDHVSLSIQPGERIALLGRPGAGKTTLLRCMAGLGVADSGQVLIDGLSMEDIAPSDRAQWMAWKSQDPALFAGTLEDNLRVAGSSPESDRFAKALWVSGLDEEIRQGSMSLGMLLEERGGNLSGGQRQKVALARVFAQPSRILLLDEPTLGLDPDSERLLAQRVPTLLAPNDVLIMTTHSNIMLQVVQRVIALDCGKVIADGSRDKLIQAGP